MDEEQLKLIIDLHLRNPRQGPGGEVEALQAIALAGLDASTPLKITDIGCGTGAGSILLAMELDCEITAVDFLSDFLKELETRAAAANVAERITTLHASMESLPFENEQFDIIWSEGAIYNIGFETGVTAWRRFLKPGGTLIVSEITWLTNERPAELESFWTEAYPEIDTASAKMAILEQHGYILKGYFPLPEHCWLENYYHPMQQSFEAFLDRNDHSEAAQAIVTAEQEEIALYQKYRDFYSYSVYNAEKR